MKKLVIVVGAIPIILMVPLMAYAASQGDLDLKILAILPGIGLLVLPSLFVKRLAAVRMEIWQLLVFRFANLAPAVALMAFGLGARPVVALVIGVVVGLVWALSWLARKPGAIPSE